VIYENEALGIWLTITAIGGVGDYTFTNLPTGEATITVQALDTVPHDLEFTGTVIENLTSDLPDVDFILADEACVTGYVVNEAGDPLVNIRVRVDSEFPNVHVEDFTDGNGYFEICNLAEGIAELDVEPYIGLGYCAPADRAIFVNGEADNPIGTIYLQPCTLVQGYLNYTGPDQPCADVEITSEGIDFEADSDIADDGSYSLRLPDGTHYIYLESDDDAPWDFVAYPVQVTINNGVIESGPDAMEIIYAGHDAAETLGGDFRDNFNPDPKGRLLISALPAKSRKPHSTVIRAH